MECFEFSIRYTLAYLFVGDDGRYIVVGIVVTHTHPDHLALAPAVADHTGSWIGHASPRGIAPRRSLLGE